MANHSPKRDNYVAKKTWDEAMSGKPASNQPEGYTNEPERNPARGNGGGYGDMTVAELKDHAKVNNIDLGDATKKDDIIAAIELAEGK